MKRYLILFCFIIGTTLATKAQTAAAEFKFEKESFDFGKIPLGKPVSVDFKFTNIGDLPLIITNTATTCGCTVSEYTKTPVKKGQSGFVKVTYNPAGSPLPFSKSITITSNAKTSTKVLYIKGETVAAATR